MDTDKTPSAFDQVSNWFSRSVTVKLFMILLLALLLLIPASMITGLIHERQSLQTESVQEVSSNWAMDQEIVGPVITIPVMRTQANGAGGWIEYVQLLPENLTIKGNVMPEQLHRGIYETIVYHTKLDVAATFDTTFVRSVISENDRIDWSKAVISIGIPDMRGIEQEILLQMNGKAYTVNPGIPDYAIVKSGVSAVIPLASIMDGSSLDVQFSLALQGSSILSFLPVGKNTHVTLNSKWQDPAFTGAFLPDSRTVNSDGFSADWKVLQLNRNFPQVWTGSTYNDELTTTGFGVELINGADDYQKSMRSVKYALLTIALTFLTFFLTETINKKRIHPFQYILVGLALCLFYILLISLSEQLTFDTAYCISSLVIVAMITLYSRTFFALWKHSLLLMLVLIGLYGYLYVTLQATDYALLIGAAGLTVMLGLTMYLTRRVNWYGSLRND